MDTVTHKGNIRPKKIYINTCICNIHMVSRGPGGEVTKRPCKGREGVINLLIWLKNSPYIFFGLGKIHIDSIFFHCSWHGRYEFNAWLQMTLAAMNVKQLRILHNLLSQGSKLWVSWSYRWIRVYQTNIEMDQKLKNWINNKFIHLTTLPFSAMFSAII